MHVKKYVIVKNSLRREIDMAKCDVCGKGVTFGIKVSHSHRRSNRAWKPNIKTVKAVVNGSPKTIHVCSRCLRSGKVVRAI
jgi:large subunit ribosomal protein L28